MTKAVLCTDCFDIVAPYRDWQTNQSWRWCQCDHTGTRWRDGTRGELEVTSQRGPDGVRVLGLNNSFLEHAVRALPRSPEEWRLLHQAAADSVPPNYLFHADQRACWALVVAVGESGDVHWLPYRLVRHEFQRTGPDEFLLLPPGDSTEKALEDP